VCRLTPVTRRHAPPTRRAAGAPSRGQRQLQQVFCDAARHARWLHVSPIAGERVAGCCEGQVAGTRQVWQAGTGRRAKMLPMPVLHVLFLWRPAPFRGCRARHAMQRGGAKEGKAYVGVQDHACCASRRGCPRARTRWCTQQRRNAHRPRAARSPAARAVAQQAATATTPATPRARRGVRAAFAAFLPAAAAVRGCRLRFGSAQAQWRRNAAGREEGG